MLYQHHFHPFLFHSLTSTITCVLFQVQYLFRVFCRLRPGISVLALHGKQPQMKRVEVYNDFVRKKAAVLFATDIAARGLGNEISYIPAVF